MKKSRGISLIVLVITIIVIIILAGAVIINITSNDVIGKANLAVLNNDYKSVESSYLMWSSKTMADEKKSLSGNGIIASDSSAGSTNFSLVSEDNTTSNVPISIESLGLNSTSIASVILNNNKIIAFSKKANEVEKYYKYTETGIVEIGLEEYIAIAGRYVDHAKWDGTIASGFESGTGTQADPYIIKTAPELAYLAQQANLGTTYAGTYFKLTSTLDLGGNINWTPIGYGTNSFQGIFDGGSNSIKSLYYNGNTYKGYGLFGSVTNGTIKNLNVENSNIYSTSLAANGSTSAAAIVYRLTDGLIDNCYSNANVSVIDSTGTYNMLSGGILAVTAGTTSVVRNCTNEGTLYSEGLSSYAGGIVGQNQGGEINNCTNLGNIQVKSLYKSCYVGGITSANVSSTTVSKISNCRNSGSVSGSSIISVSIACYVSSGGISGATGSNTMKCIITDCTNTGAISGSLTGTINDIHNLTVAGIAGNSVSTGAESSIINCVNTGAISSTGGYNINYTAGIVGNNQGSASVTTDNVFVKNCSNTGSITTNSSAVYYATGGIVGRDDSALVSYCYNSGIVKSGATTGSTNIGGIIARCVGDGTSDHSYNKGLIQPTSQQNLYVGGVIGLKSTSVPVTKSYYLSTTSLGAVQGADIPGSAEAVSDDILSYTQFLSWIASK